MEYVKAIESKHPALKEKKVWCSMDGLKLYIERPPDETIKSRYYNGWTHDHYVSNVFVFTPDGAIPMAYFNIPGCIHGSQVAEWGNIYTKFENMFDRYGVRCAVDSGFGKIDRDFMVKSTQDDLTSNKTTQQEAKLDVRMKRAATSMWQSAEWGMRGFQASFPRMKDCFEHRERRIIMKMYVLLFNLTSRLVEINQMRNIYMSWLAKEVNKEYTKNSQTFLNG